MFMSERYIDDILKREHEYLLPLGFAERVATLATEQAPVSLWDILLRLTPRAGVAIGAAAAVLVVLSVAGDGPGLFEAISRFPSLTEFFPLQ